MYIEAPQRIGRAPRLDIPLIVAVRDLMLLPVSHEGGEHADDCALRHSLNTIGVVTADGVSSVLVHPDDPVKHIAIAALVERDIILLQPSLGDLDHHQVPVLVQHRIHAYTFRFIDQFPVFFKYFFKSTHTLVLFCASPAMCRASAGRLHEPAALTHRATDLRPLSRPHIRGAPVSDQGSQSEPPLFVQPLPLHQLREHAALLDQLLVLAVFDDLSAVHDQDPVAVADR